MKIEDKNNENLSEELQTCLIHLVDLAEREDDWIRKQQVKQWKKNDRFWHGIQFIYWSEAQNDWISPTESSLMSLEMGEDEGPFYDYVINIFRAHGESVIAALSADIPAVRFPPDDADDADDLLTSKTYSKIADLIQRHNPSKLLLMKALFTLWNQGIVFAYHAPKSDEAFGKHQIPEYELQDYCPDCDVPVQDPIEIPGVDEQDEATRSCPECGAEVTPQSIVTGYKETPKSRCLIELWGPLNVKVSFFAQDAKASGYLVFRVDQPVSFLKDTYKHVADKIDATESDRETYERIGRAPSNLIYPLQGDGGPENRTLKRVWLRPWWFENLGEDKRAEINQLKKMYPKGCYVCLIGNVYVESRDECGDDYWTVGQGGLSRFIHSDPLGQPLIPIQELRNVQTNLTVDTIEHGIPSGFADPDVLNFQAYKQSEARPGMMFPAKAKAGKTLSEGFFETARATVSKDSNQFRNDLDNDAQFVVGSFPSIYGGPGEGNSRTAAEYNMSRQMALQRLSISWAFLVWWWAKLMEKCVQRYIETLIEDERFVVRKNNSYVNVFIRLAEMSGKVGEVEAEGAETFPVTMAQKQEILIKILTMGDEQLNSVIYDSENRREIADTFGYTDLYIPGDDQRTKQVREIELMIRDQILVNVIPDVDDHQIHMDTCRNFLVSPEGLDLQQTDPNSYMLVYQHLLQHKEALMMEMATMQAPVEGEPQNAQNI